MYKALGTTLIVFLLSGCSINAVQYQPDFEIVNNLKDRELNEVGVGNISSTDSRVNKISLRGTSMVSPYNKSYEAYIKEALEEQLKQADLFNPMSQIEIRGELLSNNVNAAGISVGTAFISARFEVVESNEIKFDKVISIGHEWDSSFMGAVAITNAQNNYPIAIQKLISALMNDVDFIGAIKK